MNDLKWGDARIRDLVIAVVPVLLMTAAVLLVFLVRQIYGPSRSVQMALYVVAALPLIGALFAAWSPWREVLERIGPSATGLVVHVVLSALLFTAVACLAWGGPWFVVRRILDLASPFESMKWILTTSIVLHGLAFRAVLSRRRVPAWMGVTYWLTCAAIGLGLWNGVAGLFS